MGLGCRGRMRRLQGCLQASRFRYLEPRGWRDSGFPKARRQGLLLPHLRSRSRRCSRGKPNGLALCYPSWGSLRELKGSMPRGFQAGLRRSWRRNPRAFPRSCRRRGAAQDSSFLRSGSGQGSCYPSQDDSGKGCSRRSWTHFRRLSRNPCFGPRCRGCWMQHSTRRESRRGSHRCLPISSR